MAKTFKESKDNPYHKEFGKWSNTIYVLKKIKEYKKDVFAIAILGIICNSVMSYYLGFLGKLVIDVVGSEAGYHDKVVKLLLIVLIGGLAAGVLTWGSTFSGNKVWYRYIFVRMGIIEERVSKALSINYEFLEKPETLDIHERACNATNNNSDGVEGMMHIMESLLINLTTVIVTAVSVIVLDFKLIIALILLAVIQYLYFSYIIRKDKKEVWDKLGKTWRQMNYMERVTQDFEYAKDIRLFSQQGFLLKKQQGIFENRWKKFDLHRNYWFSHSVVVSVTMMIGKAAIYGSLFYAVIKKELSIGDFTMFIAFASAFSVALIEFLRRFGDYGKASLEVDDLRSFMELDFAKEEDKIAIPQTDRFEIEFKNVSYKYPEAEGFALKNLNLKIVPGEKLAVVGLNGAGKTTMIKLLLRLYDPTEGVITLNGTDIRSFKREDYYKLFSPVFQDTEVFAFPISENISMDPADITDNDKAYRCAVEAGLKERVDSLKKGILTELLKVVDDEGVDFSGGEKQKLSLARALYKGAPIVVLDEPTSALDALAEQKLYENFDKMTDSKSAVYISHRLASTRFCDHVAMFKDGFMIEYGTHDSLMEKAGEYAKMFNLQAQYYREEGAKDEL